MLRVLLTVLLLITNKSLADEDKTITFNIPATGYPPFMFIDSDKHPSGIMFDVLELILSKQGYQIKIISLPKKREQEFFKTGRLDAHAMIEELVDTPEAYVFSDPVLKIRNVLFSLADRPLMFNTINDLYGKRAITHLGYKYPPLEQHFKEGRIVRVDTVDETAMLGMTLMGRGDFAIVNGHVGAWIIQQHNWKGKFNVTNNDLTSYDYRFMFTKKWALLLLEFNKELASIKENGVLDEIIEKYGL